MQAWNRWEQVHIYRRIADNEHAALRPKKGEVSAFSLELFWLHCTGAEYPMLADLFANSLMVSVGMR